MLAILTVTAPFFALVLAGYLAADRRVLPASAVPGLNAYVLYFALPAMLFRFGMNTPLWELLNPAVLTVYVVAALAMVGLALAVAKRQSVPLQEASFGALVAAFPNSGFMGVPLLVALMGSAAAGPVISSMLADFFVTTSLCLALAQGSTSNKRAIWLAPLSNPMPWSIAAGAVVGVAQLELPSPLATLVRMLGDSASPVALFTIGAVLWRSQEALRQAASRAAPAATGSQPHLEHRPAPQGSVWTTVWPVALLKLLVHPLLVFLLGQIALAWGLPLSPYQITALTLCAALPSASNVSLLAERHGADTGRVARIILLSTVLAFITFSAVAAWFEIQPVAAQR